MYSIQQRWQYVSIMSSVSSHMFDMGYGGQEIRTSSTVLTITSSRSKHKRQRKYSTTAQAMLWQ
jgi:hypothetical protein